MVPAHSGERFPAWLTSVCSRRAVRAVTSHAAACVMQAFRDRGLTRTEYDDLFRSSMEPGASDLPEIQITFFVLIEATLRSDRFP